MKRILTIAAALAMACAFAQEKPKQAQNGPRGRPPMMMQAGPWVVRMLSSKGTLENIGVTDAAAQDKIIAAIAPLKEKGAALEKKIREISLEQAKMTRGLFEDKERDPKPVMDKISEVAQLRAEQGRISVQAMLVLRDNLAPEQLEMAKKVIFERGRERGRMRRGEGPRHGARGGEGADGEKRRPPRNRKNKKDEAPKAE